MTTKDDITKAIASIDASIADMKTKENDATKLVDVFAKSKAPFAAQDNAVSVQLYGVFNAQEDAAKAQLKSTQDAISLLESKKKELQDKLNPPANYTWLYILIGFVLLLLIAVILYMFFK